MNFVNNLCHSVIEFSREVMLKNVILLLLVGSVLCERKNECPPKGSTKCTCEIRWGPSVTCSGTFTDEESEEAIRVLKDYKLSRLTIANTEFDRPDPDLFTSLEIDHLIFDRVTVKEDFKEGDLYFKGLEKSMTVLEISNCFVKGAQLSHQKLDHIENLETLLMNDNNILEIGNDWFPTGPKKLETLLSESNNIQRLGDKAFNALQGLKVLWIRGSNLGELKRSMFPSPAPVLEKLDISSNNLKELPFDLFTDMPALVSVSINNNQIKSISSETWPSNLRTQANLYLDGNPFRCDSDLKWVCSVKANTKAASCASPSDKQGIILSAFCDM